MAAPDASRLRALFVGEAVTISHVARPLVLAQALRRAGYQVCFACGERYAGFAESAGFEVHRLPTMSPEEFARRIARGRPLYPFERLCQYAEADRQLLRETAPDVVIGDFRVSLGISAPVEGIPYVALTNAHWSPHSTLPFPTPEHPAVRFLGPRLAERIVPRAFPLISRLHIVGFNRLRRQHGLPRVESLREMYTLGDWTLYLDTPTLSPTRGHPPTHRYLGPVLWEPEVTLPAWWDEIMRRDAIVYVTLGSSGDPRALPAVLEALDGFPVTVALATAGQDVGRQPGNVFSAPYLPALQVINRSRLVVSNGGSGTTYQALSSGVPVLGVPSNADQYFTIEAVQRAGAGLLIRSGTATPAGIGRAVGSLLGEPRYRAAARALQAEMGEFPAAPRFVSFLRGIRTSLGRGSAGC